MKTQTSLRGALVGADTLRGKGLKDVLDGKKFPVKVMEFYDTDVKEEDSKLTEFQGEPKVILTRGSVLNALGLAGLLAAASEQVS